MIQDAKKYIQRKMKPLDYVNTKLPENYSEINDQYKKVRDSIELMQAVVKSLETYEFGGTILKNFSHWSSIIGEQTKIKSLKKDDIYTDTSFIGMELGKVVSDKKLKDICNNFATAYEKIAQEKRVMNEKLDEIVSELQALKKKSKQIDFSRKSVSDTRYDLESMLQSNIYKEDEKERLELTLATQSKNALKAMNDFIGQKVINGLIVKLAKCHKEFCEISAMNLSTVKGN